MKPSERNDSARTQFQMTTQVSSFDRSVLDDWATNAQTVAKMSKVPSEVEIERMKKSDEMASN